MRCKRCGTPIQALDHLCMGCGKSIIALREDNEIIYNDEELSQVEIEKMNKKEEPVKEKIVEENSNDLDIFGDALFENKKEEKIKKETNTNLNVETIPIEQTLNIVDSIEQINIDDVEAIDIEDIETVEMKNFETPKIKEETINTQKLSERKVDNIENSIIEIIEEQNNNEVFEQKKQKNKKSKLPLILIIIAFILLIASSLFLYFYSKTSPARIFSAVIDKLNLDQIESNNIKSEISFKIDLPTDNNPLLEIVNNLDFNLISHINKDKMYIKLNPLYKNKSIINADIYLSNKEINLYLNGIYDKYIKENSEININENNIENLKILVEELKKELKKSLNSKYLNRSFENINDEYIIKSTFRLDNTNYDEFLNNLKNNKQLIKAFSQIIGLSEEVILNLEQISKPKDDEKVEIILYVNMLKEKLVKIEINSKNSEKYTSTEITIDGNTYNFVHKDLKANIENKGSLKIDNSNYVFTLNDMKIKLSIKTTYDQQLSWPSEDNKILMSEITEEETNEIMNNFMSNEGISEIMQTLELLFGWSLEEPSEDEIIEDDFLKE